MVEWARGILPVFLPAWNSTRRDLYNAWEASSEGKGDCRGGTGTTRAAAHTCRRPLPGHSGAARADGIRNEKIEEPKETRKGRPNRH